MLPYDPDIGFPSLLILDSPTSIPDTIYHGIHRNSSIFKVRKMLASPPTSPRLGKKEQFFPTSIWQTSFHPIASPSCTPAPSVEPPNRQGLFLPAPRRLPWRGVPRAPARSWVQGLSTSSKHPAGVLSQSRGTGHPLPGLGSLPAPACPGLPAPLSGATSSKAAGAFGLAGDATASGQDACPELCPPPQAKAWRRRRMKPSTPQLGSGACPRQGALSRRGSRQQGRARKTHQPAHTCNPFTRDVFPSHPRALARSGHFSPAPRVAFHPGRRRRQKAQEGHFKGFCIKAGCSRAAGASRGQGAWPDPAASP